MARITLAVPPSPVAPAPTAGPPTAFEAAPGSMLGGPIPSSSATSAAAAAGAPTGTMMTTADGGETAEVRYVAVAYAALVVGIAVGLTAYSAWKPAEFQPRSGFDAFALLYVITQSLERIFEPVATWIRGSAGGELQTKAEAIKSRDDAISAAVATASPAAARAHAQRAAGAQARVNQVRRNASVVIWGLQAGIGAILAGMLGIFILRGIGASAVPPVIDIVVTGLAIGGGSKALHELIKSVQVTKESKQDPAEAGGSS